MIAELGHEVPPQEHVLEEFLHGGSSRRVVPGYSAELRFCRLGYEPRAEDLLSLGASGAPQSHP